MYVCQDVTLSPYITLLTLRDGKLKIQGRVTFGICGTFAEPSLPDYFRYFCKRLLITPNCDIAAHMKNIVLQIICLVFHI